MAWELQRHMHAWVPPSIEAYARAQGGPEEIHNWLVERWADQRWAATPGGCTMGNLEAWDYLKARALAFDLDTLVMEIADWAIEHENSTTNGGHEVYLDGWTIIPWCDEEFFQQWWANQ